MAASDNLGLQFSSVPVGHEEHHAAISALHQSSPEKYWTVSAPENDPKSQSFAVKDQHGDTHGYYYLKHQGSGTYLGGLASTSKAPGVGSHVLQTLQHKNTVLDGYDTPDVGRMYGRRGFDTTDKSDWSDEYAPSNWHPDFGKPGYLDMARPAMRNRDVSVGEAYHQLPGNDKPDVKPDYA
jgi:hypothetical protein